jgi:hypothetical protein
MPFLRPHRVRRLLPCAIAEEGEEKRGRWHGAAGDVEAEERRRLRPGEKTEDGRPPPLHHNGLKHSGEDEVDERAQ